jgi:hypothetical protein
MTVTSNPSPSSVDASARLRFGQSVELPTSKPVTWEALKTYDVQKVTDLAVPVISAQALASLIRDEGADHVPIILTLVDGASQFGGHDVLVTRDSTPQNIVDMWWRTVQDRNITNPSFEEITKKATGYFRHDAGSNRIQSIVYVMNIFMEVTKQGRSTSFVTPWICWNGLNAQGIHITLGGEMKTDRNASRQEVLDTWRREYHPAPDLQAIHEEERYDWVDQYNSETKAPWVQGQQINFSVKPWTPGNTPSRLGKKPRTSDGSA